MSSKKNKNHKIILDGPVLPGSISMSYLACGKENCACADGEQANLHGPYYRWTGLIDGKKKTVTLHESIIEETKERIENYKKLVELVDNIKKKALSNAPWVKLKK